MIRLDVQLGRLAPQQLRDLRRYAAGVNAIHKGSRRRARQMRTSFYKCIRSATVRALREGRSPGEAIGAALHSRFDKQGEPS